MPRVRHELQLDRQPVSQKQKEAKSHRYPRNLQRLHTRELYLSHRDLKGRFFSITGRLSQRRNHRTQSVTTTPICKMVNYGLFRNVCLFWHLYRRFRTTSSTLRLLKNIRLPGCFSSFLSALSFLICHFYCHRQ